MRVLAIGAHPDDLEIHCYGTLALHVKRGDDVLICGVANGSMGHVVIPPKELAEIRVKEAQNAAKVIGAKEYFNLGVEDLAILSDDPVLTDKMIDVIRQVKPDYIISHRTDEYHRDHNETGKLVFHTSFSATCPHYYTNYPAFLKVPSLYYLSSTAPNFAPTDYVDISDVIELKLEALACHKSQVEWLRDHDNSDVLAATRNTDAKYGDNCGVAYAEVFQRCMQSCRITPSRLLP